MWVSVLSRKGLGQRPGHHSPTQPGRSQGGWETDASGLLGPGPLGHSRAMWHLTFPKLPLPRTLWKMKFSMLHLVLPSQILP